jgi:hypothetical protein
VQEKLRAMARVGVVKWAGRLLSVALLLKKLRSWRVLIAVVRLAGKKIIAVRE